MTQAHPSEAGSSAESTYGTDSRKPRYDWADPSVPVGNAPPMPRWRLYAFGLLWGAWLVFLLVTAVTLHRSS